MTADFLNTTPELVVTSDGSHSLRFPAVGEGYHSTGGAMSEAVHVYIAPCFEHQAKANPSVKVLEVGFGTGLNAFLTLCKSAEYGVAVNYTTIEAYPLAEELYNRLNYPEVYKNLYGNDLGLGLESLFLKLHTAEWGKAVEIKPNFRLTKIPGMVQEVALPANTFHCVYYDAFAPQYQPELWTAELFARIDTAMRDGALLTTYCCKGDVKRALKANGLKITKLPGFANKREMLKAEKVESLYSL
ncbi:MAG: tRNA (5-methylaminomethyl-2-thiouridine)(34)-methyltransferase MnmD [Bacteroidales bacterium]|nr:tRNA (5-methylaminomethyl-2-thiouridine)(34)-methyltransferase MnmD [Bacteroidales bacterium]MBP5240749.1 tRNA (5-methylaminomethyl-2-thiouridine)(34)-methyltransferase MnmD [Bacteroidales bacterium]